MNGNELIHHGIKGQKWGVRRFQNEDGTLTPAGKKRKYNTDSEETSLNKFLDNETDFKEAYELFNHAMEAWSAYGSTKKYVEKNE